MKKVVLYILLFFIFSSCSSEKILSDKIINKKWDINYVKSNLGNNPAMTKQDKESLNTKHYNSKNLISSFVPLMIFGGGALMTGKAL